MSDHARVTQEVIEPVVLGDTQKAYVTQEVIEPVVLGDTQKAYVTQCVLEVIYAGSAPSERSYVAAFID